MKELVEKVEKWAEDRNIIGGAQPKDQILKLIEELGEMCGAIARDQKTKQVDGVGDALVVLIILSRQLGFSAEVALSFAYEEIKDRKGKMVDGIFIKEEDLDVPMVVSESSPIEDFQREVVEDVPAFDFSRVTGRPYE